MKSIFTLIICGMAAMLFAGYAAPVTGHAAKHRHIANRSQVSAAVPPTGRYSSLQGKYADSSDPHLRLQLQKDSINTDEIYIGFEPTAKAAYVVNEDAEYMIGAGEENLASLSSDNVKLAINRLPLPVQQPLIIKLWVTVTASGPYRLNLTENVGIPLVYQVWLKDAYTKDSIDMRSSQIYNFNILKSDTNSYGSNRFSLVIRKSALNAVQLTAFTAEKGTTGAEIAWKTDNEQDYTRFAVERSIDNGLSFASLDSLTSNSAGSYSFTDTNPATGTDTYRVKLADLNGVVTYSSNETLIYGTTGTKETASAGIRIFPNPSSSTINLAISSANAAQDETKFPALKISSLSATTPQSSSVSYSIKIVNISGFVVKTATASQPTWQDNISSLLPGTYIIQVIDNSNNSLVGKSTFIKM